MSIFRLDGIDLAQLLADRAEEFAAREWESEALMICHTADIMRKRFFIYLSKVYVANYLIKGRRDVSTGNQMERVLYQSQDDFILMAKDLPEEDETLVDTSQVCSGNHY